MTLRTWNMNFKLSNEEVGVEVGAIYADLEDAIASNFSGIGRRELAKWRVFVQ